MCNNVLTYTHTRPMKVIDTCVRGVGGYQGSSTGRSCAKKFRNKLNENKKNRFKSAGGN